MYVYFNWRNLSSVRFCGDFFEQRLQNQHNGAFPFTYCCVRSPDCTENTERMCAVLSLGTDTRLAAVRIYFNVMCLKLRFVFFCLCAEREHDCPEGELINDHIFALSQGSPTKIPVNYDPQKPVVSVLSVSPVLTPLTLPSLFADTQLACVGLPRLWWRPLEVDVILQSCRLPPRSFMAPRPWRVWKVCIYMVSRAINKSRGDSQRFVWL